EGGFDDGHRGTGEMGEEPGEAREAEPFGGDVDELVAPPRHVRHAAAHLTAVDGGSEIRRGHAARDESVDLILHESDERRDDEGGSPKKRGGELINEALAASGGRHPEQASGGQERLPRLPPAWAGGGLA